MRVFIIGLVIIGVVIALYAITSYFERRQKRGKTILHLMLDLETMSTASNAYIRSIGAVFFSQNGLGAEFYQSCDGPLQPGSHVDENTKKWWANQSQEAQKALVNPRLMDLEATLRDFAIWVARERMAHSVAKNGTDVEVWVWGNGGDFDPVIVDNAFKRSNRSTPWAFYNVRCYRTLKNLFRSVPAAEFVGEKHNALDDAKHQAKHATQILNSIGYWDSVT